MTKTNTTNIYQCPISNVLIIDIWILILGFGNWFFAIH